jgi:hypothetical protein
MGEEELEDRIVEWPTKIPRRALRPPQQARAGRAAKRRSRKP